MKKFDVFFNFDGDCREALDFYAKVFGSTPEDVMTYGETPPGEAFVAPEADKDRIMYANLPIFGCNVMFSDTPAGSPYVRGNNISPTLGTDDKDEITRLFHALKEGGQVHMDLEKTFWSDWYAMVEDRYGIIWQLSHWPE